MKEMDKTSHEAETSSVIKTIAVERGLRLPETAEEVALFEERFAREIALASQNPPSLKDMLTLAASINDSDELVVKPKPIESVDDRYAMAARGGKAISPATLTRLDEAIQRVKSEKKPDE